MSDSQLIVVKHGFSPSPEYDVLAYGADAFDIAQEHDVVEESTRWDGMTPSYGAIGGHYAVIDDEADTETLEQIKQAHRFPEMTPESATVKTVDGDGELIEQELVDVDVVVSED